MAQAKIALVKENNEYVGFACIVEIEGKPVTIGSLDEPLEIIECSREQLMNGFLAHPQEGVMVLNQNTNYEDEVERHINGGRRNREINNNNNYVLE